MVDKTTSIYDLNGFPAKYFDHPNAFVHQGHSEAALGIPELINQQTSVVYNVFLDSRVSQLYIIKVLSQVLKVLIIDVFNKQAKKC
ncbi:hypothetical protein [Rufibacter latericius]|nr:hypothetical protein [Rufibacter latericius]